MERLNQAMVPQVKRPQSIRVMQFGEGGFLRAFVDEMLDNLNTQCGGDYGVAIVQPLERGMCQMLRDQDCLYTVMLRGREEKGDVKKVKVVGTVLTTVEPYADFQAYLDLAKLDTLRFIVSNTTEAGIVYTGTDKYDDKPQPSYPGKLTRFLHERFLLGKPGFIIMPCELIDDNGCHLKDAVLKTAKQWALGDSFIEWLEKDNIFCSTLVDRIVTGFPRKEVPGVFDELGYEDQQLDTAEPFGLWVIEGPEQVKKEIPLDQVNPVIFTDNVKPYKLRKVRMLNGAHTTMVLGAYLAGLDTVGECMADKDVRAFLQAVLYRNIMPNVPLPQDEVEAFAKAVLLRFENPFNRHELLSIALNSVSKWTARVLPTLKDNIKSTGRTPGPLSFGLTALILFYAGIKKNEAGEYEGLRNGKPYTVKDDAHVLEFFSGLDCDMPSEELVHAVLSNTKLWGEDLTAVGDLECVVEAQLSAVRDYGIREVMLSLGENGF
ncbi:MAG: tagaturonate reductase [Clostridia bacterium]|nr:tagaturonate reductase [Clostridia bacterium]